MFLYHIHRKIHHGDLSRGYIGITNNTARRWYQHMKRPNLHLGNALSKYHDIEFTILTEDTETVCTYLEIINRPIKNIGWNIAAGGGLPPKCEKGRPSHCKGKTQSKVHISRRVNSRKCQRKSIIIEGIEYKGRDTAAKAISVSAPTILNRIRSSKFPSYQFKTGE